MFDNVGEKLKGLAVFCFWVIIIATVICTFYFWIEWENFLLGFIVGLGGFLVSLSSWFLYAFGQLVQDVNTLAQNGSLSGNSTIDNRPTFNDLPNL